MGIDRAGPFRNITALEDQYKNLSTEEREDIFGGALNVDTGYTNQSNLPDVNTVLDQRRVAEESVGGIPKARNFLSGYLYTEGGLKSSLVPSIEDGELTVTPRYEDSYFGAPREFEIEGYGKVYYDPQRAEIVKFQLGTNTRGPKLRRIVLNDQLGPEMEASLKAKKEDILKFASQGFASQAGRGIAIGELAALPFALPAIIKGGIKGIKYLGRKTEDLISDISYGDPRLSATRGVLSEPTAVGSDVINITKPVIGPGYAQNLVAKNIDFNLSRDENLKLIKELGLKARKGTISDDYLKKYVNEAFTQKYQLPVDDYSKIYRSMYLDRKYNPTEFGDNWNDPLNIMTKNLDGSNKLSNYRIPNQVLAKQKVALEIAEELDIPVEQARIVLQKRIEANSVFRKKDKALQKLRENRGTPEGDLAWANYTARIAERKAIRREKLLNATRNLSTEEKILRKEQRTYAKYINDLTVNNENVQKMIINNEKLNKMLSTKIDVNTGVMSSQKVDFKNLFNKNTDSRLFEIDHVKSVETNIAGLEYPANRQLIFQPLHRNFKQPAINFIEKLNVKVLNGKDLTKTEIENVKKIIAKAKEFDVSMQPDVAEGFLKQFGVSGKIINPKKLSGVSVFREYVEKNLPILKSMDEYKIISTDSFKGNALGGAPINRKEKQLANTYAEGDEEGVQALFDVEFTSARTLRDNYFDKIKEVQDDIKQYIMDTRIPDTIRPIIERTTVKGKDILKTTEEVMTTGERPVEFRLTGEGYKLITDSPIVRSIVAAPITINNIGLELVESIYNGLRKGTENDIDMEEKFPTVYNLQKFLTQSVGPTPDDQTYVSFIDELNRAQETGFTRLGYSIIDLAALSSDWIFDTKATEKVKESYDNMVKEGRFSEPETFLGEVGAIAIEFGIPAGSAFKMVNGLRRMLGAGLGVNLFKTQTYGLRGASLWGTKIGNVAKRVGTGMAAFGLTDFIAGGPYNTVSEVFKGDPLLFDQALGYDYEDTEELSGKELATANFKNRLRFAADGALIGGMFPLVGPPLWLATKYGVIKPSMYVAGKTLQLGDELAIKPFTYLAGGTLKAPFSAAGKLEVKVPGLGEVSQSIGSGINIFSGFLGKDIITRAAVTAMGARPGFIKQLPDFKEWRMFDVNSADPLKKNLKKIDRLFQFFREAGIRSPNQLYLDVKAQNFIRSKSRTIEKQLNSIEVKAYDLANGFLKRYNSAKTSPAGEEYLLDQTLAYLKGQIKLSQLPEELQSMAKALSEEFDNVRSFYKNILPEGHSLKNFLTTNLKSYMRQSFAAFTNPQFKPNPKLIDDAVDFVADRIRNNESLVEIAMKNSNRSRKGAIEDFARQQIRSLLATVKTEGFDPIVKLQTIAKNNLKLDDLVIQTGEELPNVIRKLLGEEKGLRSSVMQTTSSLITQATNLKNYDRIANLLLKEGRLFSSRDEAVRAGLDQIEIVGKIPGLGLLDSDISRLYGSPEVVKMLQGSLGTLDKFMQSSIYQGLIAYKAGVQTGKTVLSPATQTRNFGSAAAFPLNNGWIGGGASVTDAFKITLDDIFGAGRTVKEEELIKQIGRKSELGVIDENIVASELSAVLADIKAGKVGTFGQLASRADSSKLMKTATRLYSGGDNVWKWYSHEYLMSALKGSFKSIDEVKKAVKDDFGITEFNPKNMTEAIEEYSAMLVRELMPTYSKVPPVIQAIRKIPFIGNFVSFPAEIIRTSFATSTLAMKHIASDNPTLRAMGYRSLIGQAATLYALNEGARGLGYAMTNITSEQIRTYKDYFAPDYMKFSDLVPISNLDRRTGTFKVFDMSRYNPYDLISSTVNNLIVRATDPRTRLDPEKIETDVFAEYFNAAGPLLDLLNGTMFGLSIGTEGVYEAFIGKTKTGSAVYSPSDTSIEKWDKAIMHIFNKNEPGIVSSAQRIWGALSGDVSGTGQPLSLKDEMFKLLGGSTVVVDVPGSFAFKISEFQNTFKEPKVSESWYSTKNYKNRGPAQLVREYNEMNEEAFREQYRFYQAVQSALDSRLMTTAQIEQALKDRKISQNVIDNIIRGRFTPLSWGLGGLEARYNKIKKLNPKLRFRERDFIPEQQLDRAKDKWERKTFRSFEIERKEPEQVSQAPVATPTQTASADLPTTPLPDTGPPVVNPNQMANVSGPAINPQTGLTDSQSVYLSPTEKLYYQRNRTV